MCNQIGIYIACFAVIAVLLFVIFYIKRIHDIEDKISSNHARLTNWIEKCQMDSNRNFRDVFDLVKAHDDKLNEIRNAESAIASEIRKKVRKIVRRRSK